MVLDRDICKAGPFWHAVERREQRGIPTEVTQKVCVGETSCPVCRRQANALVISAVSLLLAIIIGAIVIGVPVYLVVVAVASMAVYTFIEEMPYMP